MAGSTRPICDYNSYLVLMPSDGNRQQVLALTGSLLDWINDTVRRRSIVVRSFFDDLWDGGVLVELVEILRGVDLGIAENVLMSVSTTAKREKWQALLHELQDDLGVEQFGALCGQWGHEVMTPGADYEMSVHATALEELIDRNPLVLLQIVTQLAQYHRSGGYPKLPVNVSLDFIRATRHMNTMVTMPFSVQLTAEVDIFWRHQSDILELQNSSSRVRGLCQSGQRHVLVDSLLEFVNNHITAVTGPATEVADFSSGVLLILLAGMLGSFFIRLDGFFAAPFGRKELLHNAGLALSLFEDSGASQLRHLRTVCTAEDIVEGNEKSILQLLYAIKNFYA